MVNMSNLKAHRRDGMSRAALSSQSPDRRRDAAETIFGARAAKQMSLGNELPKTSGRRRFSKSFAASPARVKVSKTTTHFDAMDGTVKQELVNSKYGAQSLARELRGLGDKLTNGTRGVASSSVVFFLWYMCRLLPAAGTSLSLGSLVEGRSRRLTLSSPWRRPRASSELRPPALPRWASQAQPPARPG